MSFFLTFDLFALHLSRLYPCRKLAGFTDRFPLEELSLPGRLPEAGSASSGRLYLIPAGSWHTLSNRDDPNCAFLLFDDQAKSPSDPASGNKAAAEFPSGNALLVALPPGETDSADRLFQAAFSVFLKCHQWREAFLEQAAGGASAKDLLTLASGFLDVRFFISTTEGDIYCFDTSAPDTFGIFAQPKEEVEAIMTTQSEFPASFTTHGVQPYPSPYNGLLYYYNIFQDTTYLARILCVTADSPDLTARLRLFRYLAPYAERAYVNSHSRQQIRRSNPELITLLERLVSGVTPESDPLKALLAPHGWHTEDAYQVLQFRTENLDQNLPSQNYFCACIDSRFPSCCAVLTSGSVCCIRNLSLEAAPAAITQQLNIFARDNLCRVGFSNIRTGILTLPLLQSEAADALRLGSARHPHRWTFQFRDNILLCIQEAIAAKYPASELEHPALPILREHDRAAGADLLHTLQVFTEERFSASAAARELYIHRSTFLHRLERIVALTGLDFDNKKDRAHLTLSFLL